jgi:hypothetical protein
MNHPEYLKLSQNERDELIREIAYGRQITRSCPRKRVDWFRCQLSTGATVTGAYQWDSPNGEFLRLNVKKQAQKGAKK